MQYNSPVETQLYWVSSRYYSPELCRWISPDDIEYLEPQSINGLNLYCYCMNNPVTYADHSGHFVDVFIDGAFLGVSIVEILVNPSWENAGWLALDLALVLIPFFPNVSGFRHFNKVDNGIDIVSTLNKIDNVGDTASIFKYTDDIIDSGDKFGTYLLKNEKGEVIYVGKGSRKRMMISYDLKKASSWMYYPAKNADIALANEAYFMSIYGGAQSVNIGTRLLNKINSPGLRRLFWWF